MKLTVDKAYLERFDSLDDACAAIDRDLEGMSAGDEIELIRGDDRRGYYVDVLAHICGRSITGRYVLRPSNENDVWRINAVLGNNVEGDMERGYRFQRKSAK